MQKCVANSSGIAVISIRVQYGTFAEVTDTFTLYVSDANLFISGDSGNDKQILTVGETKQLTAEVVAGENASQEVEWISDTPTVATVDSNGLVTAIAPGEVIISAKSKQYKYAIDTAYFEVIDVYTNELIKSFDFTYTEAKLIRSLYDKIDTIYSSQTNIERAWRCARLLSEFVYDGNFKWDDVANTVTDSDNREVYFVDTLGYTNQQYAILDNALITQHRETNTIDFCHLQYSLAVRLAYTLEYDSSLSNWGTGIITGNIKYYTNEEISYFAGWLGDAVLTGYNGDTTSFGNDDYTSDLDAENIYRSLLQGGFSVEVISNYYMSLSNNNRAYIFTSYISYETVQKKVFYELIDAELYRLMNTDPTSTMYYNELLNNEEYHWDIIKNNYYDTYNFLNSLRDCRANISNY